MITRIIETGEGRDFYLGYWRDNFCIRYESEPITSKLPPHIIILLFFKKNAMMDLESMSWWFI